MFLRDLLARLEKIPWLAEILALAGGILYVIQSWTYAHTQDSVLDEGLYLLKGYLFASGRYQPFQEFGPWTNHMPLSFLIPGYFQVWFGEGIRTGRLLSICLGILFLIAFWILAKRFGGSWLAAGAIWVVALNPAMIKVYSVMTSQVLVICILMWIFVLTTGEDRTLWQIILGAGLAGLLPLTRLNMLPLLPLLLIYIVWEQGFRWGIWAIISGLFTFSLGNFLYWPEILGLWDNWIPKTLISFLQPPEVVNGGTGVWNPEVSLSTRWVSFFEGIRYHFFSVMGMIGAFFLWFSLKKDKRTFREFKTFVFLSVFFVLMFYFHAWASLTKDYCVFCFSSYLSFFGFTGVLILILALSNWYKTTRVLGKIWMWLLVVFTSLGIAFSYLKMIEVPLILRNAVDFGISISIPRVKDGQLQGGSVGWLALISNKFGWDYAQVEIQARLLFMMVLITLIGGGVTWLILKIFSKLEKIPSFHQRIPQPLSSFVLLAFILFGLLLSPTAVLAGGRQAYDCDADVIASFEENGNYLAENIPPGSQVYWKGWVGLSLLLYQTDLEFFPAQFNNVYSYREGGDPVELEKSGLWNETLARQWAAEADYILIAERYYSGWLADYVENGAYMELTPTSPLNPCRPESRVHIYRRIP
jgi:hypothetical protein